MARTDNNRLKQQRIQAFYDILNGFNVFKKSMRMRIVIMQDFFNLSPERLEVIIKSDKDLGVQEYDYSDLDEVWIKAWLMRQEGLNFKISQTKEDEQIIIR